jgi:E3 ubiquitin-protein ligase RNFT1
LSFI